MAAGKLVSGDSLIKQASLSGNRLRNHTVTGKQINVSSLGMVPSADSAISAVRATSATTATSAVRATSATTAASATTATTAGSAPISTVTYVTATGNAPYNLVSETAYLLTATCPAGTTVIGGGGSVSNEDDVIVNDSYPSGKTGWSADFYNSESGTNIPVTVTAICAPAAATAS
jgi:hypothetical protein